MPMTTSLEETSTLRIRHDWRRQLRSLLRTPLLLLHLMVAFPLAIIVLNPFVARQRIGGERIDQRMIRWWSGALVRRFGFRIRAFGVPLPGAVMYVANHVSWLDIE